MSSCLDPKGNEKSVPTIIQGEDKTLTIKLTDNTPNKIPIDITAATEIKAIFLNTDGTFLEKLLTTAGIVIVNGPSGLFQVILFPVNTEDLKVSGTEKYSDIEIHLTIAGKLTIVILEDVITILPRKFV